MSSADSALGASPQPEQHDPGAVFSQRLKSGALGLARGIGAIRIPDFVLLFLLAFSGEVTATSFKASALVVSAAVALAAFRRPQYRLGTQGLWIAVAAVALLYVAAVSVTTPPETGAASWEGRLLRLTAVFAFLFCLASGRLDLRSGLLGYASAMVLNIPLFYAGLVSDNYGGYLTGIFGDKNVSGMVYSLFGLMLLWYARSRVLGVVIYLGIGVPLWLTGSRTSIAAYVAAGLWIVAAPYLPLVARWILGGVIYGGVNLLASSYARVGVFEGRLGSDELRGRIDAASLAKVHETSFFGRGLGSAFVDLGDAGSWFFHNSYWSALVEGGWPWTLFLVGMTVLVMIRPFSAHPTREQIIGQGVGIAVLVCASQLGEVFGTEQWAVAVAFALRMLVQRARRGESRDGGAVIAGSVSVGEVPMDRVPVDDGAPYMADRARRADLQQASADDLR